MHCFLISKKIYVCKRSSVIPPLQLMTQNTVIINIHIIKLKILFQNWSKRKTRKLIKGLNQVIIAYQIFDDPL